MERLIGVWVEGPGYDITYGGSYDGCARRCLASTKCVMIEFYRPERKCNLYDRERPRLKGGASVVGLRR
ncbi:MAG: PAN domain-containing protein [Hyphomicrobiaceae bacterium]|nr:PAN domain-containing protein [Hyphomicrobiaceae bacterium]